MRFRVIIPARYASQRLPGKPLADIHGRPLILHVCDRASESGAQQVLVATDDARVQAVCAQAGVEAVMTRAGHASGTDRIAEVVQRLNFADDDVIVNLQGDEPLMPATDIEQVAALLNSHQDAEIATLCTAINDIEEFLSPNVVKVTADQDGRALYFSRAPIPWNRDGAPEGLMSQRLHDALRHIGLYAYRVGPLKHLAASPACKLEELEKLEQLRALWLGMRIVVDVARETPGPSVDTPEDLRKVTALMQRG